MSDVIGLQAEMDATPEEEKASRISVAICRNSYRSIAVCFVK